MPVCNGMPLGFLLVGAPEIYLDAVNRKVIRPPNCTEDKGIIFGFFPGPEWDSGKKKKCVYRD